MLWGPFFFTACDRKVAFSYRRSCYVQICEQRFGRLTEPERSHVDVNGLPIVSRNIINLVHDPDIEAISLRTRTVPFHSLMMLAMIGIVV